jgi:hypothetical protein
VFTTLPASISDFDVYVPLIVLLEAPTARVAIGFPVIVKPPSDYDYICKGSVPVYCYSNYITYFSCSTYCSCFQEQYEEFVSMGYP